MYILTQIILILNVAWSIGVEDHVPIVFADVTNANCSESLKKVRDVPIKYYEFKFDSVEGRMQMGVLGVDAERYFPDSVEVIPTYSVPNRDRTKPNLQIKNFPLVDKNVLFMHCLAALKELIGIVDGFESMIDALKNSGTDQKLVFDEIEKRLSKEADAQLIEEKKYATQQALLAKKEEELESLLGEQERMRMMAELDEEKGTFEYQEKLYNERIDREEKMSISRLNEALKFEAELAERRELLRRQTELELQSKRLEFDRDLEQQKSKYQENQIVAEIQARAEQERANEDMTIRKIQLQATLDRRRFVEGLEVVSKQVFKVVNAIRADPAQFLRLIGIFVVALALYYIIKEFSSILRQHVQSRLGRPTLVRETSYTWSSELSAYFTFPFFRKESLQIGLEHINKSFRDVILSSRDKDNVIQLALSTRNTKQSGAPFRHILLHGPPGTGKTLIARRLAECSGMDYAIMSGGDIGPLGDDAVNQLHGLFRWANRSRKGLLVFIDESEAFMGSREKNSMQSSHVRHALNALLYQTGTQSKSFMLVLATNRPEELDPAVLDRIDVSILIDLPAVSQRKDLVNLYMHQIVVDIAKKSTQSSFLKKIVIGNGSSFVVDENCYSEDAITEIAQQTEGFSGRSIAKLMIALQYEMFLTSDHRLTKKLLMKVLDLKRSEHIEKKNFQVK